MGTGSQLRDATLQQKQVSHSHCEKELQAGTLLRGKGDKRSMWFWLADAKTAFTNEFLSIIFICEYSWGQQEDGQAMD